MSRGFKLFLGVLMVLGIAVYLIATAIFDMTNKEDLHTVNIDMATEVLEVEHSISGLIPMGTDHYYIGINEDTAEAYIIKAPKKWLDDNFGVDKMARKAGGLDITALAKSITDSETRNAISSNVSQVDGLTYPVGTNYLDTGYKSKIVTKLILFAGMLFLAISGFVIMKKGRESARVLSIIFGVLFLAWCIAFLILIV
ncbi:MAG: hypothetical protein IKK66_05805 [Ruminococcus sp.]|nr:hypothetical protein [Ruminococcus sp.]